MSTAAVDVLKRDIKFWEDQCRCSPGVVDGNIDRWFNFAFCFAEQEEAKRKVKQERR